MISLVSSPLINSSLSLLVYITRVSSDPGFKDIKSISAINCIFHSPTFLYWFINFFKYFPIKARYS